MNRDESILSESTINESQIIDNRMTESRYTNKNMRESRLGESRRMYSSRISNNSRSFSRGSTDSKYSSSKVARSNYFRSSGFDPEMLEPLLTPGSTRIDEQSAKMLAEKLFDHYNRSKSGKIEEGEARTMIADAYLITGRPNKDRVNEYSEYIKYHDVDKDGSLTLADLEVLVKKYLCGPSGRGMNLTGDVSEREKLLRYLYRELGYEKVQREILRARDLFERFDEDKNGYLEPNEVKKMMEETYSYLSGDLEITEQEALEYIESMDPSRDKMISKGEFEFGVLRALYERNIKF